MRVKGRITTVAAMIFACILLWSGTVFAAEYMDRYYGSVLVESEETHTLAKGKTWMPEYLPDCDVVHAEWSSSDQTVASVNEGIITGKKVGTAVITVSGTLMTAEGGDQVEKAFTDAVTVVVTNPKLSQKSLCLNIYDCYQNYDGFYYCTDNGIVLQGLSDYSTVEVTTSSAKLRCEGNRFWGAEDGTYQLYFYPAAAGTYTVKISVDGKDFTVKISVYKAYFVRNAKTMADYSSKTWVSGRSMVILAPGESTTLRLKGVPASEKVKYTSSKTSVVKVNSSGKLTGKSVGYATVTADIGGIKLTYEVGVSYKKAVGALRYAAKHYGSVYSQEKRMETGYYDCSSFVWRSYKSANAYIGSKSWAPTAADMAKSSVKNGTMVYSGTVDMTKLLPGDLIFFCGTEANGRQNGRYMNIYHVDIYQGNQMSMTVESQRTFWNQATDVMVARPCGTQTTGVKASVKGYTSIKLSWSGNYGASGYQVFRSTKKTSGFKKIATVKGTEKTYQDANLSYGKTYYYKVRPYYKAAGKTYKGQFSAVIAKKTSAVKPKVSVSQSTAGEITLGWAKISGANGYEIYRRTGTNGSYQKIKTIKKGETTSFTDQGAKKNKEYYYKVKSYRTVSQKKVGSDYSDTVKIKKK